MSGTWFLGRWTVRVLIRQWREHLSIWLLVTAGVGLSVGGALGAYNLVEPPETEFGGAQIAVTTSRPDTLRASLLEQSIDFAVVESAQATIDGRAGRVALRSFDAANPIVRPLLDVSTGRLPSASGEIAVTDRLASDLGVGSRLGINGITFDVVGIVENPTSLSDEFGLVASVSALGLDTDTNLEFLVGASESDIDFSSVREYGVASDEGPPARTMATLLVNVVGALGILEIGLIAGASFAVLAKRRAREFGLLAAAGASPRQVRLAASATGLVIGLTASAFGTLLGVAAAAALVPSLETTVGHRIAFAAPLWAVLVPALVAVAVTTGAARWPTRLAARGPVVDLLHSYRPTQASPTRPGVVGVVLTVIGAASLGIGFAKVSTPLALAGTVVAPIGLLLLAPFVVHGIGLIARRTPLPMRIAARSIARHNRRSAAAVAAIALAVSIPVGIAVVTTSLDSREVGNGPNLDPSWMIAWVPGANDASPRIPVGYPAEELRRSGLDLAAVAPESTLIPIEVAVPPGAPEDPWQFSEIGTASSVEMVVAARAGTADCAFCDVYSYGFENPDGTATSYVVSDAWVASPALLDALAIGPSVPAGMQALASGPGVQVATVGAIVATADEVAVTPDWPTNASVPDVLLAPSLVDRAGFDVVQVGWFLASPRGIDDDLRSAIITALDGDMSAEFHQPLEPRSNLRRIALLAGVLTGLALATSTVRLLGAELAPELRVLVSIGGSPSVARLVAASTASLLVVAAASLAVLIGHLPLVALLMSEGDGFPFVIPWQAVTTFLILFPLMAAGGGWLSSRPGTQATSLADSI